VYDEHQADILSGHDFRHILNKQSLYNAYNKSTRTLLIRIVHIIFDLNKNLGGFHNENIL
jgi:hypothetical protein